MTEELVTLETAKLLKEKGFNEFCEFACRRRFTYNGIAFYKFFL